MFKQDYLMRIIEDSIRFLVKIVLNKDSVIYELADEVEKHTPTDLLHTQLLTLINQGKINEAENMLYEELDRENKRHIELALDFYRRLNDLDDEFLEKNNFPREEIEQGLKTIAQQFGISI